jgi:hypothetical protein
MNHKAAKTLEMVCVGGGALLMGCGNWAGYTGGILMIGVGLTHWWARKIRVQ